MVFLILFTIHSFQIFDLSNLELVVGLFILWCFLKKMFLVVVYLGIITAKVLPYKFLILYLLWYLDALSDILWVIHQYYRSRFWNFTKIVFINWWSPLYLFSSYWRLNSTWQRLFMVIRSIHLIADYCALLIAIELGHIPFWSWS